MTCLYYRNISKPNTLWIILSKCFHCGTFRLIFKVYYNSLTFCDSMTCCSLWQAQYSSFATFLSNELSLELGFFLATITFYQNLKNFYRNISQESFCNFTRSELSPCIWISLSNSMGKPDHGIYVISFTLVVLFLFQNSCILAKYKWNGFGSDRVYFINTTQHDKVLKWGPGFESSSNNRDTIPTGQQTKNKCQ